jgi:diaminopimelate decarboxylase
MSNWYSLNYLTTEDNKLTLNGINAESIAKEFGTPCYVYLENRIRDNANKLISSFRKYYPNYKLLYAIKANNNINILKILADSGVGGDASCLNEIKLAKLSGMEKNTIFFTAVFPSPEEISQALQENVIVNLENINDIELLSSSPPKYLSFRINPDITTSGSEGLKFAGPDAKFGISSSQAVEAYRKAQSIGVKHFGAHIMTGSNILDEEYFAKTVYHLFEIISEVAKELSIEFEFINIGGSIGVPYKPNDREIDIDKMARLVSEAVKECCTKYNMKLPLLMQEPGRFLLADSGFLLSSVKSIKHTDYNWLGLDAGMNILIRPALYKSYHHIVACKEVTPIETVQYNIVGPICENTDIFAKNYCLPKMNRGDIIAFYTVGAYGYGMCSQYNSQNRPAEVLINKNAELKLIRRKDEFKDLIINIITEV